MTEFRIGDRFILSPNIIDGIIVPYFMDGDIVTIERTSTNTIFIKNEDGFLIDVRASEAENILKKFDEKIYYKGEVMTKEIIERTQPYSDSEPDPLIRLKELVKAINIFIIKVKSTGISLPSNIHNEYMNVEKALEDLLDTADIT